MAAGLMLDRIGEPLRVAQMPQPGTVEKWIPERFGLALTRTRSPSQPAQKSCGVPQKGFLFFRLFLPDIFLPIGFADIDRHNVGFECNPAKSADNVFHRSSGRERFIDLSKIILRRRWIEVQFRWIGKEQSRIVDDRS